MVNGRASKRQRGGGPEPRPTQFRLSSVFIGLGLAASLIEGRRGNQHAVRDRQAAEALAGALDGERNDDFDRYYIDQALMDRIVAMYVFITVAVLVGTANFSLPGRVVIFALNALMLVSFFLYVGRRSDFPIRGPVRVVVGALLAVPVGWALMAVMVVTPR